MRAVPLQLVDLTADLTTRIDLTTESTSFGTELKFNRFVI